MLNPTEQADGSGVADEDPFWQDNPHALFATFLGMVETYCYPSVWEAAHDQIRTHPRRADG